MRASVSPEGFVVFSMKDDSREDCHNDENDGDNERVETRRRKLRDNLLELFVFLRRNLVLQLFLFLYTSERVRRKRDELIVIRLLSNHHVIVIYCGASDGLSVHTTCSRR